MNAWKKVWASGIKSQSQDTRNSVKEFEKKFPTHLRRIYEQLQKNKFKFEKSIGAPISRKGKTPRPLVIAPVKNRIVQRSVLDVLQGHHSIQKYIDVPYSFGGIKNKSVKDAIAKAYELIKGGYNFYIKSDIAEFFTDIPRPKVINQIATEIDDSDFINLLDEATKTELANMAELREKAAIFPTDEEGVAQGCCLSPLFGNILLFEFDKDMNDSDIACLRYIDDFLILAKSKKEVWKAFRKARGLLNRYNLRAYHPDKDNDTGKAKFGETSKTIEYLGCEILPGLIRPDKKSIQRLLQNIKHILSVNSEYLNNPQLAYDDKKHFIKTTQNVSHVIQGWGNSYSFCNDLEVIENIDQKVEALLNNYIRGFQSRYRKREWKDKRRLLGIHLLCDSKKDFIISDSVLRNNGGERE